MIACVQITYQSAKNQTIMVLKVVKNSQIDYKINGIKGYQKGLKKIMISIAVFLLYILKNLPLQIGCFLHEFLFSIL